ncbi:putative lmgt2 [Leptomonas pyrrhocoris]|uniref:Putative lmgt2 n=1 Tax=Leptomonas pyrrhocoris TaxID=157538 RepID=A0A0M9FXE3_LEPPY|nr:putative lmgt2 [Leptomonas pyrrhocoris]KPA77846.1 putative lmgt2 [Leptomonas pyrrhocoris]|eukprot:XP_015656285.1 putative lmgt2 [Leptomonas pyrrhocoris]
MEMLRNDRPTQQENASFASTAFLPLPNNAPSSSNKNPAVPFAGTDGALAGPTAPQPEEPVAQPSADVVVVAPNGPLQGNDISTALRLAVPPPPSLSSQLPPPPPPQQPSPLQSPLRSRLHREEHTEHSGSSLDSEDHFIPPRTAGRGASRLNERASPPPQQSDGDLHSDHLAHATYHHREAHPKDEFAMTSPNINPPQSKKFQRSPASLLAAFNRQNIKVTVVPIICGLISGYSITLVPVYTQLFVTGTNCALYTAQKGCESVPFADCMWRTATVTLDDGTTQSLNYCGWLSITCRATYPNDGWMGGGGNTTLAEMRCLQDSRCTWSYSAKECQNPNGFSPKELAIFAGSMIAGNVFGAFLGGPLVTHIGARLTFIVSGLFSVVTSIMGHLHASLNDFWVLASSRFVLGIFMGLITVACPLYVHENALPRYKQKIGFMFQIFGTTGSLLAGFISVGEGESIDYAANASQHISARMQGITAGQTLLAILLFLLGVFCADSKVKFKKGVEGALNQNEYSYWKMAPRLMMVIAINASFRFTGFNALTNFAPKLMSSFNVAPFLGVFFTLVVNFVGAVASLPASLFVSPKTLFLFGSCFISCMCLFLCGIPVYPGVASASVTNTCAVVGICLFIFAFELFVGPSFYVILQEIFPPSFRPRGNSFAQLWQFFFNLVINVCYPIAVIGFSGGEEGDQHKGQAIIFIFFGALGLVLFVYEFFCLDLWDSEAAEAERKPDASNAQGETPALNDGGASGGGATELVAVAAPTTQMTDLESSSGGNGAYLERDLDLQEVDARV